MNISVRGVSNMKYHKHIIEKVIDSDVDGGCYWNIHQTIPVLKHITYAWTLSNAKEFIDSFDGKDYNWNILC